MLHPKIPVHFQRFPIAPGFSTRHAHAMDRKRIQQLSDMALSSELERLGEFARTGIDPAVALKEVRVELLGVGDRRKRKAKPRHRPPGIDEPLKRDKIVQTVLFERAAHPEKQIKDAIGAAMAAHDVSYGYVYRCLNKTTPERAQQMIESIIKVRFLGEMIAHLTILAGTSSAATKLTSVD